jgi:hypothetical protein
MGRIEKQYELVKKQVEKAPKLFEDKDMLPEAIQNIFSIFENCANLIKDVKHNIKKTKHSDITFVLQDMFRRKVLKKNYSKLHSELAEYRVIAFFGEYSRNPKPLPPKASLKHYLESAIELFDNITPIVEKYIKEHEKSVEERN